jgi:hypothetical protein
MEEHRPKETQSELFPEQFSSGALRGERLPSIVRPQKQILLTTNTEQMLMAGIISILLLCGVFFLGVVRGKAIVGLPAEIPAQAYEEPLRTAVPAMPPPAAKQQDGPVPPAGRSGAATAPRAQNIPAESTKPYTIQLVTHRKKDLAEQEMNGLRAQGFYSFLIPSGVYFQVCVGQYASKDEAKKDLARFAPKFKDCFLRRR